MAGKIGQVTGQEVKTYKGVDNIRVLQVALFGASPESVVYINTSGEDTAPVNGDFVIVRELGADKYTFGVKDLLLTSLQAGEKELYSRDDSQKFARLKMKLDGSVGIKNETQGIDFLIAFTAFSDAVKAIVTSDSATVNSASQTAIENAKLEVLKVISGI